ncbi:ABC transporter permease [Streptococcus suis]|uniref:ABC transporter permease n=1 Tax=Streptococcus parasuis TaxID=1501662 RepID=UPI0004248C1B|nr:ABC transporter permease [Streptococcus suis]BCP63034.1 ABC transporter ATP-binding protein [Streptococcus parasuis]NQM30516.1 ABC transporter permease [Streptococcus suis]NQM54972.1 ABC transporter permease [Streptococcus suis]NQQ33605.1 ABC transporter permease [Streptococcus suis]
MFRRMNALIWLRNQILLSNKNLSVQILLPFMLVLLYKNFMEASGMKLMFVCLSMAISMSIGMTISTMIAEEKEKNMLKTLLLSGVRYHEYILSVLIHPLILTVITLILFPVMTDANLEGIYIEYIVVMFLTTVAVMLINMCIGLLSDTQSKAQINGLPITFIVALLPMFSLAKEGVATVVSYTFMGAYTDFFIETNFSMSDNSIKILLLWNVILIVLTVLAIKRSKVIVTDKK